MRVRGDNCRSVCLPKRRESLCWSTNCVLHVLERDTIQKTARKRPHEAFFKGKHPTPFHENHPLTTDPSVQGELQNEGTTSSLTYSMNRGSGESTSKKVPVWISSPSTSPLETLVYALLDTQSSHTFAD